MELQHERFQACFLLRSTACLAQEQRCRLVLLHGLLELLEREGVPRVLLQVHHLGCKRSGTPVKANLKTSDQQLIST